MVVLNQLIQDGRLSQEQAEAIHEEHLAQGRTIRSIALEQGYLEEKDGICRLILKRPNASRVSRVGGIVECIHGVLIMCNCDH